MGAHRCLGTLKRPVQGWCASTRIRVDTSSTMLECVRFEIGEEVICESDRLEILYTRSYPHDFLKKNNALFLISDFAPSLPYSQ